MPRGQMHYVGLGSDTAQTVAHQLDARRPVAGTKKKQSGVLRTHALGQGKGANGCLSSLLRASIVAHRSPLTVAWRSVLLPARCFTRTVSLGKHH